MGSKVWDKSFSPSMAILNWCALTGKIPTDDLLKLKGLRLASKCVLCESVEESFGHIFAECQITVDVWKLFGGGVLQDWQHFKDNLGSGYELKSWKSQMLLMRFRWMERNGRKHEGLIHNSREVCCWMKSYGSKLKFLLKDRHDSNLQWKLIKWCLPRQNTITINIDGCYNGNLSVGGIGGIYRNFEGKCIVSFLIANNSLQAEYYACWWAVRLAAKLVTGCSQYTLWFESDSIMLVKILNMDSESSIHWSILGMHRKIKRVWLACTGVVFTITARLIRLLIIWPSKPLNLMWEIYQESLITQRGS